MIISNERLRNQVLIFKRERKKEQKAILSTTPLLISTSIVMANNDSSKCRDIASMASSVQDFIPAKEWSPGMITQPGDLVYNPLKTHIFIYGGKDSMSHSNPTFHPGAAGVYYWLIVPEIYEDVKVYPDIPGIIVSVRQNEIWWNKEKTKKYKWNSVSNSACNWSPGDAGVHQWVEMEE